MLRIIPLGAQETRTMAACRQCVALTALLWSAALLDNASADVFARRRSACASATAAAVNDKRQPIDAMAATLQPALLQEPCVLGKAVGLRGGVSNTGECDRVSLEGSCAVGS